MSCFPSSPVAEVSPDLRGLKREVLTGLASRLAGTTLHGIAPRIRRGPDAVRVTWDFTNGVHALVFLGTVKQGLPSGCFALEPRLIMSGGPLAEALQSLPLPPAPAWDANHYLVNADCAVLGGATSTFVIRPGNQAGAHRAEADLEGLILPAVAAFAGDWDQALDVVLAHPAAVAFAGATAAILIGWTARNDLVPALREAAEGDPWIRGAMTAQELVDVIDTCAVPAWHQPGHMP